MATPVIYGDVVEFRFQATFGNKRRNRPFRLDRCPAIVTKMIIGRRIGDSQA
jgi:hypothetical protein